MNNHWWVLLAIQGFSLFKYLFFGVKNVIEHFGAKIFLFFVIWNPLLKYHYIVTLYIFEFGVIICEISIFLIMELCEAD